jgi:hypothetical protein
MRCRALAATIGAVHLRVCDTLVTRAHAPRVLLGNASSFVLQLTLHCGGDGGVRLQVDDATVMDAGLELAARSDVVRVTPSV